MVCQQQRRWSEAPLEEMMGKMHCYAIAILQAALIESLKACAGAPFFTCVVSVAYFSAGFVVE